MLGLKMRRAEHASSCSALRDQHLLVVRPATTSCACCRRSTSPTTRSSEALDRSCAGAACGGRAAAAAAKAAGMIADAVRHFLDLSKSRGADLRAILDDAHGAQGRAPAGQGPATPTRPLDGKVLAMIFEKPSTRTRVSFDVGMRQLGGETIMLDRHRHAARPRRDHRRHRPRAVALCRRDHDPHHHRTSGCWSCASTPPSR